MNAIFAAASLKVPIDACVVSESDVPLLQQAASITGGVYVRPLVTSLRTTLLQTLLMHFLVDNATRQVLNMPHQARIDMRASCVCHQRLLDIGFVCSVCLSIFCDRLAVCDVCQVRFELPTVAQPH